MNKAIYLFLSASLLIACSRNSDRKRPTSAEVAHYKESLVGIHKEIVKIQTDSIQKFVDSLGWKMQKTPTGLWYSFTVDVAGVAAVQGNEVTIGYRCTLLNGELCYSSDSLGHKHFVCGQGGVESGIEEAVLRMSKGDKARFILPSHLAYGVAGDFKCIPRLAILIYDVEMMDIMP